jgi:hypothetical protein
VATRAERSVDWLQRLYAVVVGLALTEGLKNAVMAANTDLPKGSIFEKIFRVETWPIVALIFTLVPFFHGANRHLDDTYVFGTGEEKNFALVIDFLFFFVQGAVLYWMALVIQFPRYFFQVYCVLLFIDIFWAVGVYFYTQAGWQTVSTWVRINLICVLVALILLATPLLGGNSKIHALGIAAVLRTVFDYSYQWRMYYPPRDPHHPAPEIAVPGVHG